MPTVPDKVVFRIDYAKHTHSKYMLVWKRLTCYCLRALEDPELHQHEFCEDELRLLRQIKAVISAGDVVDDDSLDDLVLRLSVRFIQHGEEEQQSSAIMHFMAVLGMDERV